MAVGMEKISSTARFSARELGAPEACTLANLNLFEFIPFAFACRASVVAPHEICQLTIDNGATRVHAEIANYDVTALGTRSRAGHRASLSSPA